MGIKNLWHILSSTAEKVDLREVSGSVVAVDLSGWIVENAKATPGVSKPHLRNLFFRCAALSSLGILPVFVSDARSAPRLKTSTLMARRGDGEESSKPVCLERRRLNAYVGECRKFIQALGLPFVESPGEAEGFCVQLKLDAVVSEDSDVFAYGSDFCLWRNFSITGGKFFSVEKYDSKKIENLLGLSRDKMLFLAIMLGCDYFPTGIPGVGKESILNLFNFWDKSWNALDILDTWIASDFDPSTPICGFNVRCKEAPCRCQHLKDTPELIKIENSIKKKCQKMEITFWTGSYPGIIQEFMSFSGGSNTHHIPTSFVREAPDICHLVALLVTKLAWTESYAFQKALPLLSRWQISRVEERPMILRLVEVLKKRAVDGIPSLEVRWAFLSDPIRENFKDEPLITVEPTELLAHFNPDMVNAFLESKAPKKKSNKPLKKDKKKTDVTLSRFLTKKTTVTDPQALSTSLKASPPSSSSDIDKISQQLLDCSLNDTREDNEDLSLIIEDILSKKPHRPDYNPLKSSTPTQPKKTLSHLKTLKSPSNEKSPKEKDRNKSLEDSFDRMCNPSEWKDE